MATTFLLDTPTDSPVATPTHLVWADANGQDRTEPLTEQATTVGAGPRCAVRLVAQGAKPLHCVIQRGDAGLTVRRWSSDTQLNGQSFTEAPLAIGDRLTIAGVELLVDGPAVDVEADQESEPSAAIETTIEATDETIEEADGSVADEPVAEFEQPVSSAPPVPSHLLQPWVDANPRADSIEPAVVEEVNEENQESVEDESASESASEAEANGFDWGFDNTTSETPVEAEATVAPSAEALANELPTRSETNARDLRVALQTAHGRTRRVLAALRSERASVAQVKTDRDAAGESRDELAAKLMLATTELHDCRNDLDAVQHALNTAKVEASDHRWLFAAAQIEVADLEGQVASLRGEVNALTSERALLTEQREQLEAAITQLEERLVGDGSLTSNHTPAADVEDVATDRDVETAPAADAAEQQPETTVDPWAESLPAAKSASPWDAEPAAEAVPVEEAAPADNLWSDTPPTTESPADAAESATTPEPAEPTPEPTEPTPAANDPWTGVWGIEKSEDEPTVEPSAIADRADEGDDIGGESAASDEDAPAVDSWLASFKNNPTPNVEETNLSEAIESAPAEEVLDDEPLAGVSTEKTPLEQSIETAEETTEPTTAALQEEVAEPFAEPVPEPSVVENLVAEGPVAEGPVDESDETNLEENAEESPVSVSAYLEQAGILTPGSLGQESAETATDGVLADETSPEMSADSESASEPFGYAKTPDSVQDLIADDQPSTEAPVSFIEKYADTLPADDTTHEPAPEPVPPILQQPAFDEAPTAAGEGDEESIEDYMAKLMQRMRGDEESPSPSLTTALAPETPVVPAAAAPSEPVAAPEPEQKPVEAAPLESLEELRRGPAPEAATDMSSLRDLANQTARSAIDVSEVKQDREQATVKLVIAGIAMGCGAFMAITATSWIDPLLFVGIAGFGWSAYWFHGMLKLTLDARAKASRSIADTFADQARTTELPIAPK